MRQADPLLIRAAVSFGAGRWSVIRKVILPSALPMVFAGLRLGAGIALLLLVAAEQIAADAGIGFLVLQSGNLMETTKLMVGIVVLSLLGVLSHWGLSGLERAVIRWRAHLIGGSGMRRFSRLVLATAALAGGMLARRPARRRNRPRRSPTPLKVGVLKLTSSAPIFVGVEKGYFKEFGVEPELVYFQAAAPIATALAAGQLDVGATGLTAALYNIVLGGEKLWIVADKGREWPGYPLVAIVVQKELWDAAACAPSRTSRAGRIGVTQIGSTFHYHIGNILEKDGLDAGRREDRAAPGHARHDGGAEGQAGGRDPGAAALPGRRRGPGLRQDHGLGRRPLPVADRRPSSTRASSPPIAPARWPS